MAWLGDWANRVKLTLDHTKIDSDQIDFPVMLHISASSGIGDVDVSDVFDKLVSDANRKKIAVTTSGGVTQCYAEIERWDDANEQSWLWMKVPALSSAADPVFYQYYDPAQADNTTYIGDTGDAPVQSVWDSNFKAVYHMAQDPNGDVADSIKDSTNNQYDGTPAGTMTSADLVDSKIGKGIDFDGNNDGISIIGHSLNGNTELTLECTFNLDTLAGAGNKNTLVTNATSGYGVSAIDIDNNVLRFYAIISGTQRNGYSSTLTAGTWYYGVGRWKSGESIDVFINTTKSIGSVYSGSISLDYNTWEMGNWSSVAGREIDGIADEVRISDIARSDAWTKATYYSNWDGLITFEFEEEEVFNDLNTEIAADPTATFLDLLSDIQTSAQIFQDLKSSIEATFTTNFADLKTEIYSKAQKLLDLLSDVRAGNQIITDLKLDINAKGQTITDLKTFIKAITWNFRNLNTSIEAVRSKWWLNTEIKAGCAARWNFNTEWNPNRFLCTQIAAKKPYEFSFKTQTDEDYTATDPEIEFKISGYSFPLRTLFLDYIPVGGSNEYPLELWWARGLTGKGTLKNAKIKAEYIDTQDSGGYEVVTCDWISCKVNGGEYGTVNETPLALGDIPCDSKLDITLKVECRDCSLTRGLVFFRLIISGDYKEAVYGDSIVYRDGSRYHVGEHDDYRSIDFISRLYVVI